MLSETDLTEAVLSEAFAPQLYWRSYALVSMLHRDSEDVLQRVSKAAVSEPNQESENVLYRVSEAAQPNQGLRMFSIGGLRMFCTGCLRLRFLNPIKA